jgi:uncharacterized protein
MISRGGAPTSCCALLAIGVSVLLGCQKNLESQRSDTEYQGDSRVPPLIRASSLGDHAAVERLIRQGANVNAVDERGITALHYAVNCHNIDIRVVRDLVNAGADINARTPDNVTPLMNAVSMPYGKPEIALELIRAGAKVNVADSKGETALWIATTDSSISIIRALLEAGADANAQGPGGNTPLHMAALNGSVDVATVLLQHGADVMIRNSQGQTVLDVADEKQPAIRELLAKHVRTNR